MKHEMTSGCEVIIDKGSSREQGSVPTGVTGVANEGGSGLNRPPYNLAIEWAD
jgi:hypothetical protein